VLTPPDSTLVALVADDTCDVFTVADEMLERGWFVQPQMSFGEVPPTLHLTLSAATAPSVPELVVALQESVDAARAAGPVAIDPGLAGLLASIDPTTLDDEGFAGLLAAAGLAGGDGSLALPTRMAPVNALLDACPLPLREALLLGVLDRLSRPTPG
jgi:sphinganine-1-phosphate aldolase